MHPNHEWLGSTLNMSFAPPAVNTFAVSRITISDVLDWFEFAVLPEMQRYTSSSVTSQEDLAAVVRYTQSGQPNASILFAVRDPESARLLGVFGFHTISVLNRTAEITYEVRPEASGQGLASAMCLAATQWALQSMRWVRVQATVLEENVASLRVLQKCGYLPEGRLRNFRLVRGQPRDYLLYSCVPEQGLEQGPGSGLQGPGSGL
jgi:RimJ/RimL family protein N-acetyltransferase